MTLRLLSSDTIRRCFVADPGKMILSADYDQVELRIAAALAGETSLIEAAKRGESLHEVTATRLFGSDFTPDQKRYAKNVNFGWLFGGGAKTLSEQAGIPIGEAREIIVEYTKAMPKLAAYKKREQNAVVEAALSPFELRAYRGLLNRLWSYRGDTPEGRRQQAMVHREIDRLCWGKIARVHSPFGRPLLVNAKESYRVVNYKIQSAARDVLGEALIRLMDDPELEPTVLLPIHDEVLGQAQVSKAERIAQRYGEVMTTEFMGVPLTATGKVYGKSWGDGYKHEN